MVFYGSEFFVIKNVDVSEEQVSNTIDNIILDYQSKYFSSASGSLATVDARWCIFYSSDYTPTYFYCFTLVEFEDEKQLNHFKLKNPVLFNELKNTGLAITVGEIESRLGAISL